eukprot:s10390_g1.t2
MPSFMSLREVESQTKVPTRTLRDLLPKVPKAARAVPPVPKAVRQRLPRPPPKAGCPARILRGLFSQQ